MRQARCLNEIMATPDKSIPGGILAGASCVVVIPSYKKGAFVVGAQYGQGVATCRTPEREWSAPVCVQLTGGSFGFQVGGQATDLVLVAMNDQGLQDMLKNKFKLGADAAASAGPVGRNAQAGTDWKMNAEFLTLFAQQGPVCRHRPGWNGAVAEPGCIRRALYGSIDSVRDGSEGQRGDSAGGATFCAHGGEVLCSREEPR